MRVYYSIPVEYNRRTAVFNQLAADVKQITKGLSHCEYWEQGTYYSPETVKKADIFVFAHTSNEFNLNIKQLPSGVQKELNKAIRLGKSIYYLYYTMGSTTPNYYRVIMNPLSGHISGVAGSSPRFFEELLGGRVLTDPTIKEHPLTPKKYYKTEVIVPNKKMLMF